MSRVLQHIEARNGEARILGFDGYSESFHHEDDDVWVVFENDGANKVGLILPREAAIELARAILANANASEEARPEWMAALDKI